MEPYFLNYINPNNYNLNRVINIRASISTYRMFIIKGFTKKIKVIFNNINKVFTAKILFLIIKQKKSIRKYIALFK